MGPAYSGVQNEKDNKERTGGRAAAQKALNGGYYLDTRRVQSWDGAVVFKLITRLGGYYLWSLGEIKKLQEYLPARMYIRQVSPAIEIYADLD